MNTRMDAKDGAMDGPNQVHARDPLLDHPANAHLRESGTVAAIHSEWKSRDPWRGRPLHIAVPGMIEHWQEECQCPHCGSKVKIRNLKSHARCCNAAGGKKSRSLRRCYAALETSP